MRYEKIYAQALDKAGQDRYLLAEAVGRRAEQLSKGAKPLVDVDLKKTKLPDVALMEIAADKISIEIV
ncbi:MAG: DNA-directed RNA polymerase subunit omega [Campylobacterales bacterium]